MVILKNTLYLSKLHIGPISLGWCSSWSLNVSKLHRVHDFCIFGYLTRCMFIIIVRCKLRLWTSCMFIFVFIYMFRSQTISMLHYLIICMLTSCYNYKNTFFPCALKGMCLTILLDHLFSISDFSFFVQFIWTLFYITILFNFSFISLCYFRQVDLIKILDSKVFPLRVFVYYVFYLVHS